MSFLWNESEIYINQEIRNRRVFDNLASTHMDVWRAIGREALLDNPESLLWNIGKIKYEQSQQNPNEKLSEEEFNRDYDNLGLEYDPNMTHELVKYLLERKRSREINEFIISRGEGGFIESAGSFGAAVLSSLASPTNIALSFVPVGGQARWAQFGMRYGKIAASAAKGASAGIVFQAGFEPIIHYSRELEHRDYTLEDSITNLGVSAVFGSMVNVMGYGASSIKNKLIKSNLSNLKDLYIARRQIDEGKHIDLDVPHEADSIYNTGRDQSLLEIPQTSENSQKISQADLDPMNSAPMDSAPINSAIEFIDKHRSKKVGFKEFLRQTELRANAISKELLCGLISDLEKADLAYEFKSKHYRADIARELANITTKEHSSGYTSSKGAAKLAQIIYKWQNIGLSRARKAGINITPLDGYITRQTHSASSIRKMGWENWRDFIMPLLDLDKSGDVNLKSVYDSLATGIHDNWISAGSGDNSNYRASNLAKILSAERKLHFKSADHWMEYNAQCGKYNLSDGILMNLQSLGKSIGLVDMLGTNPDLAFSSLKYSMIDSLKEKAASGDKYALNDINYLKSSKLDHIFGYIHDMHAPDNPSLASIGRGVRALKSMSSLGSVVISSLPDIGSWASELSNQGIPILQSYKHVVTDLLKTMISGERRDFAKNLGIASDSMLGFAYDRLNVESPALGTISKMTNIFFKLNCMDWWDSSFKASLGLVLSNNLANHVNTPFTELPLLLQNQLRRYDINESNWHLYKAFRKKAGNNPGNKSGNKESNNYYLLPDSTLLAADISMPENLPERLANNLRRYLADRADTAIASPQAAEKAIATWGTSSGTGVGEFVRFFMQFKTFPISYIMRPLNATSLERVPHIKRTGIFGEDIRMALQNSGTIASMTHLLIATTVFGYLSICARQLLKGEELPDPAEPKVWSASVVKGGGLGIFGDFIFNEYDRYGRTLLAEAQGPVMADINSIASIIAKAKNGDITKSEEEALRLLINNIPGRNLFYLQPAITLLEK